jgi:hypothetical protein
MGNSLARDAQASDRGPRFAKASQGRWLRSPNQKPMIVRQSSGDFSREKEEIIVRHYGYFFMISQQKPGKRYFGEKWQHHLPPFLTQSRRDTKVIDFSNVVCARKQKLPDTAITR